MKVVQKYFGWELLTLTLTLFLFFMSCPMVFADSNEVTASTWEDVNQVITSATMDTTVILSDDIDVTDATILSNCSQYAITITSKTSKTIQFSNNLVLNSAGTHLVFKNLKVRSCGMINVVNGTLDFDDVTMTAFTGASGNTPAVGINTPTANGVVNIYGGSFSGWNNASVQAMTGSVNFLPTSNVSVDKLNVGNGICKITPQGSATISASCSEVETISASETSPYSFATGSYTNLLIETTSPSSNTSTMPTVTGTLIPEKTEAYNCGDTVKVTVKLTPDAAAKLSSGSLKFSYDTTKLRCTEGVPNSIFDSDGHATFENGVCTATFTSKGDPLDVTTEGLVLAEFSFEAVNDGTAEFGIIEAVAADEKASACTTNTGDPLSVTINALPKVTTDDFGSDYKMVKYVADALPEEGNAYFIGDTALTYVPAYATEDNAGKYIFVMLSKDKPTDTTVTTKAGTYGTIAEATGDANGDTKTNIIDAQVVYYMTTNKITSSDTGYDWLNSDVNGDCTLDALDAHAIQYFVHYGKFGQFSS